VQPSKPHKEHSPPGTPAADTQLYNASSRRDILLRAAVALRPRNGRRRQPAMRAELAMHKRAHGIEISS
jgi:hypothetical protein